MNHKEKEKHYILFSTNKRRPTDTEIRTLEDKTKGKVVRIAVDLLKIYPPSEVNKEEWVNYCASELSKVDFYKVLGVTGGTGVTPRPITDENIR